MCMYELQLFTSIGGMLCSYESRSERRKERGRVFHIIHQELEMHLLPDCGFKKGF